MGSTAITNVVSGCCTSTTTRFSPPLNYVVFPGVGGGDNDGLPAAPAHNCTPKTKLLYKLISATSSSHNYSITFMHECGFNSVCGLLLSPHALLFAHSHLLYYLVTLQKWGTAEHNKLLDFNMWLWTKQCCFHGSLDKSQPFQKKNTVLKPGPTWVLAFCLALFHAPEVVGIAKAATIKESLALLSLGVKEVTLHQPSTGTWSLCQMTWVLVL